MAQTQQYSQVAPILDQLGRPPSSRASLLNWGTTAVNNWMIMVGRDVGHDPREPTPQCCIAPPVKTNTSDAQDDLVVI